MQKSRRAMSLWTNQRVQSRL